MAFKLVRSAGSISEPAVVSLPASGVIRANSVVIFDASAGYVSPASITLATGTAIIGVALDYVQGASDVFTRVILFNDNQLWEGDVLNVINTAQILKRFRLYDSVTVENTSYDQSLSITGVFQCLQVSGASTGSAKVIGRFMKLNRATTHSTDQFR